MMNTLMCNHLSPLGLKGLIEQSRTVLSDVAAPSHTQLNHD